MRPSTPQLRQARAQLEAVRQLSLYRSGKADHDKEKLPFHVSPYTIGFHLRLPGQASLSMLRLTNTEIFSLSRIP